MTISSRLPFTRSDASGATSRAAEGRAHPSTRARARTAKGPEPPPRRSSSGPGRSRCSPRRQRVPGQARARPARRLPPRRELRRARGLRRSGVVPGEMPSTWPADALKAQAVAARSYALSHLVKGKPFDLYSDVRSQVYRGVDRARSPDVGGGPGDRRPRSCCTAARSRARCTSRPRAGRRRARPTSSARASRTSSPGRTRGTSTRRTIAGGRCSLGARTIQSKLGAKARVVDAAGTADAVGPAPIPHAPDDARPTRRPVLARPHRARPSLDLVLVGVLRLDRPKRTVVFGSTAQLSGVAADSPPLRSQLLADGTAWAGPGPSSRRTRRRRARSAVKPTRDHALPDPGGWSAAQPPPGSRVQVSPRRASSPQPVEPGVLSGTVQPKLGARSSTSSAVGDGAGSTSARRSPTAPAASASRLSSCRAPIGRASSRPRVSPRASRRSWQVTG